MIPHLIDTLEEGSTIVASTVAEVMSTRPRWVRADSPVSEAARLMRDHNVGAVVVVEGEQAVGICTDRDITVRVTATGRGPDTTAREACSGRDVVAVAAGTLIPDAIFVMNRHALRRLPVLTDAHLVGIVSLTDLTRDLEPDAALTTIGTAEPNR